jgi:DNA-formamidopyrimidine glycosylase
MPEGPEVTVIRQGLHNLLQNQFIQELNFDLPSGRYSKKKPDGYNDFIAELPTKVKNVSSKGKFIYFEFDNGWYMYNTLGMSGGWYMKEKEHATVVLTYSSGSMPLTKSGKKLWFDDQRHFGTVKFVKGSNELENKLKTIGPDLLNDTVTDEDFIKKYRKHNNKKIDVVVTDQKIFSGIGNYLKAEILYKAKISPHAIVKNIPDNKLKELLIAIKHKITDSYKLGGASVQHYSDLNNNKGKFNAYFEVYKKKVDSNGHKVISERVSKPENATSQKTYWVPDVQKDEWTEE